MTEPKWIRFEESECHPPKTRVINVVSKQNGYKLGEIRWWGRWRQYCFFPAGDSVYEKTCLTDIILELIKLMNEQKASRNPGDSRRSMDSIEVSLCQKCNSMTHTRLGMCGKCHADKPSNPGSFCTYYGHECKCLEKKKEGIG